MVRRPVTAFLLVLIANLGGCSDSSSTASPAPGRPADTTFSKRVLFFNNTDSFVVDLVYGIRSETHLDTLYKVSLGPQTVSDTLPFSNTIAYRLFQTQHHVDPLRFFTPFDFGYGPCVIIPDTENEANPWTPAKEFARGSLGLLVSDPDVVVITTGESTCDLLICDQSEDCGAVFQKIRALSKP